MAKAYEKHKERYGTTSTGDDFVTSFLDSIDRLNKEYDFRNGVAQKLYDALSDYENRSRNYISTAYDRFGGRKEGEAPEWNGASSQWYDEAQTSYSDIKKSEDRVRGLLNNYWDLLDDDYKTTVSGFLKSAYEGVERSTNAYENEYNFFCTAGKLLTEIWMNQFTGGFPIAKSVLSLERKMHSLLKSTLNDMGCT